MAEPEVPNSEHELPDEEQPPPPAEADASPARINTTRWWAIWDDAVKIQADTGRSGTLTSWEQGWAFSNWVAETADPALALSTRDALGALCAFFEKLEWAAVRLEGLFHDGCPPETAGALLNVLEWIREGLGLADKPVDVRDLFPPLEPALEKRLSEMQAVINYWASFAAGRSKQISALEGRVGDLEEALAQHERLFGPVRLGADVLAVGERVSEAVQRSESLLALFGDHSFQPGGEPL